MKPLTPVSGDRRGFTLTELLVTIAILGLVMGAVLSVYMSGTTIGLTGENKAEAQQAARAAALMEEDLRLAGYGFPTYFPPSQPQPAITAASPTAITFWADLMNTSTTLTANVNAGTAALPVATTGGFAVNDPVYLINGTQFAQLTVGAIGATTITVNPNVACPAGAICPPAYPQGAQLGRPRSVAYSWNAATLTLTKDAGDGTGPQPLATGIQAFQLTYFDGNENPTAVLANIRRIAITLTAQSAAALNRGTFTINSTVRPRNLP